MNVADRIRLGSREVASLIRTEIERRVWRAHDRLPPERRLAEDYGVARGTVREALNLLASEGLVEIRRGSGTYVLENAEPATSPIIQDARPLELIDTRFALEPHICRLAVLHARPSDLRRMEELLTAMENSVGDPIGFANADTDFHNLLAESTGNRLLSWIISQISGVRNQDQWDRMRQLTLNQETITAYNAHHRQIVDAIRRREPEEAAQLMKSHLEAARLSLTRAAAT